MPEALMYKTVFRGNGKGNSIVNACVKQTILSTFGELLRVYEVYGSKYMGGNI